MEGSLDTNLLELVFLAEAELSCLGPTLREGTELCPELPTAVPSVLDEVPSVEVLVPLSVPSPRKSWVESEYSLALCQNHTDFQ